MPVRAVRLVLHGEFADRLSCRLAAAAFIHSTISDSKNTTVCAPIWMGFGKDPARMRAYRVVLENPTIPTTVRTLRNRIGSVPPVAEQDEAMHPHATRCESVKSNAVRRLCVSVARSIEGEAAVFHGARQRACAHAVMAGAAPCRQLICRARS